MGQRPARCECRPRHDADAGCRNPEGAARIQNVPTFARFAETFCQSLAHLPIDSAPQQVAAVVEALNTVRKNNGNNTPLELNEQACAFAKEMAQVMLDGVNGQYGKEPTTNMDYTAACANVRNKMVGEKASIGFGALQRAYPDAYWFEKWANKTEGVSAERNNALVKKEATLVGVGIVQNADPSTRDKIPFMVAVMTYGI